MKAFVNKPHVTHTDVLIIGAGLAGLYAAVSLDPALRCLVVTKEDVKASNSWLAQGGIAAAISPDDQPLFHLEDTLVAGAGLCDKEAVRVLVEEGPGEIETLRRLQVPFDLNAEGELQITREGGHNHHRVVHAGGDATGRETVKRLAQIALSRDNIQLLPNLFLVELVVKDGMCQGAFFSNGTENHLIYARGIILATGGIGQIYQRTTNPSVATGDGIAAALLAGAGVSHMEFIQFHPTALYLPHSPTAFLISEALRGEGATLLNCNGEHFMEGVHPLKELAPRDIVALAIFREMKRTNHPCVYLDITNRPLAALQARFPTITNECLKHGLDISRTPIPVSPAQHYLMGGVQVNLDSQSSLGRLYACGETSCTGVHGANRLASNSMLECLVFGRRAAKHISGLPPAPECTDTSFSTARPAYGQRTVEFSQVQERLRECCQQYAGVVRTKAGLTEGLQEVRHLARQMRDIPAGKLSWETQNMLTVAESVFEACLSRDISIGAHTVTEGGTYAAANS